MEWRYIGKSRTAVLTPCDLCYAGIVGGDIFGGHAQQAEAAASLEQRKAELASCQATQTPAPEADGLCAAQRAFTLFKGLGAACAAGNAEPAFQSARH